MKRELQLVLLGINLISCSTFAFNYCPKPLNLLSIIKYKHGHGASDLCSKVTPLSSCSEKDSTDNSQLASSTYIENHDNKVGFYVHIPYCRRRCRYCDFAIVPVGDANPLSSTSTSSESGAKSLQQSGFEKMNNAYTNAILTEIDVLIDTLKKDRNSTKIHLDSIYFGGGTPSLAPLSTIQAILQHISEYEDREEEGGFSPSDTRLFEINNQTEITMEMDPGTFTLQQLKSVKEMGINRISLGVQSFNDTILNALGRVHTVKDVYKSISMIAEVYGYNEMSKRHDDAEVNYSIDLISGLPGLDCAGWIETLQKSLELRPKPKHLSLYDLQIETGTVFGSWYENEDDSDQNEVDNTSKIEAAKRKQKRKISNMPSIMSNNGILPLPSADDCAFMYKFASGYLRSKGYEHYEISSYAMLDKSKLKKSYRSQHNQIYWGLKSTWFAVGLGATSCINGRRYARPRLMSDYISWSNKVKEDFTLSKRIGSNLSPAPIWIDEDESWKRDLEDTIMTRLRTKEGLDLRWISNLNHGDLILERILIGSELGIKLGFVHRKVNDQDYSDQLCLTDPQGYLFSNSIISSIFAELNVDESPFEGINN